MPILVVFLLLLFPRLSSAQSITHFHKRIPMRDGVELCSNIFLPAISGDFNTLLQRTPYGKPDRPTINIKAYLAAGYAVVVQDVRGRRHSSGQFRQFDQEENDGFDAISWIAKQSWSNGRVGLVGGSYSGIAAWRAVLSRPPALKALAVAFSGGDEYLDRFYSPGGALRLAHRTRWIAENYAPPNEPAPDFRKTVLWLPLRTADLAAAGRRIDFWRAAIDHPSYDSYWSARSTRHRVTAAALPAHITAGWYDPFLDSDLDMFTRLRQAGQPARMLIGPWGHGQAQPLPNRFPGDYPPSGARSPVLEWFDAFLKETVAVPPSAIRYFLMGANEWRESPTWPPPETEPASLYLSPRRSLEERPPSDAGTLKYVYSPRNAVPTIGGALCCNFRLQPWGPLDQRPIESRNDVLVFTSTPRRQPLDIAGFVRAVLYVASDAPDTDFTAKLIDVAPDGNARILVDGILRLRYRQGLQREVRYTPGTVERIEVHLGSIAHRFLPGHAIRLHVSSSNFPRFDRNLNTGNPQGTERELRVARQELHISRDRPSALLLPAFQ